MKVIDVLNRIANGEEVPKKIKYKGHIYQYQYKDTKEANIINYYHSEETHHHLIDGGWHDIRLNDEVEIIEEDKPKTLNDIRESYGLPRIEDKKIEKLDCDIDFDDNVSINGKYLYDNALLEIGNKINEIIDYLNKEKK